MALVFSSPCPLFPPRLSPVAVIVDGTGTAGQAADAVRRAGLTPMLARSGAEAMTTVGQLARGVALVVLLIGHEDDEAIRFRRRQVMTPATAALPVIAVVGMEVSDAAVRTLEPTQVIRAGHGDELLAAVQRAAGFAAPRPQPPVTNHLSAFSQGGYRPVPPITFVGARPFARAESSRRFKIVNHVPRGERRSDDWMTGTDGKGCTGAMSER